LYFVCKTSPQQKKKKNNKNLYFKKQPIKVFLKMNIAEKWNVDETAEWLGSIGLESKHVDLFKKEEINGEALFCLETSDFVELVRI